MNDDLIREVNEAMKVDRARALWNTHGKKIMMLAVAIVALAGGFSYWQQQQHAAHQQWTNDLMAARDVFRSGDAAKAKDLYEALVKNSTGAQSQMAGLWLAKSELKLANQEGVLNALNNVIKQDDAKNPSAFAALACLQGAALAPEDERFVTCLSTQKGAPLKALADEHKAVMLMAKGDYKAAKAALPKGSLSPDQQARIDDMSSYIASKTTHED